MKVKLVVSILGAMFLLAGCDGEIDSDFAGDAVNEAGEGAESSENEAEVSCATAIDCTDVPNIAVWDATCDGDILLTPEGSGDALCVDGLCTIDFTLVETDCSDKGGCGESTEGDGYAACGSLE